MPTSTRCSVAAEATSPRCAAPPAAASTSPGRPRTRRAAAPPRAARAGRVGPEEHVVPAADLHRHRAAGDRTASSRRTARDGCATAQRYTASSSLVGGAGVPDVRARPLVPVAVLDDVPELGGPAVHAEVLVRPVVGGAAHRVALVEREVLEHRVHRVAGERRAASRRAASTPTRRPAAARCRPRCCWVAAARHRPVWYAL